MEKVYRENGVRAVNGASLVVRSGETHAVVGENGAGKSTLMHIISGYKTPDAGDITVKGNRVRLQSPHTALIHGIGMVYQNPMLLENLPVWKNMILGTESRKWLVLMDRKLSKTRCSNLLRRYRFPLGPDDKTGALTGGKKVLTALASVLLHDPEIIILDEPTASATEEESEFIFNIMNQLNSEGKGILLISHKLRDIFRSAHTVTVLKAGTVTAALPVKETDNEGLVELMHVDTENGEPAETALQGETVFELKDCSVTGNGQYRLDDVNFSVRQGEILGITGVREHGLWAIEALLAGEIGMSKGRMIIEGREIKFGNPGDFRKYGIAYVPADRTGKGVSTASTLTENLMLLRRKIFFPSGFINKRRLSEYTAQLRNRYRITGGPDDPLFRLSGGNIQKTVLARELDYPAGLLILSEPGWGLDVNSRTLVFSEIRHAARKGQGVIILSSDIDEVIDICSRVLIVYEGTVIGDIVPSRTDPDKTRRLIARSVMGKGTGQDD
ncbi:MAG: ATP-binding cassette domain-containing protein [Spirochaetia bacterium]